jgi:hypothetical protein
VPVREAVVLFAFVTFDPDHLLLLALLNGALLVKDLPPLLGGVGLALGVEVAGDGQVGRVGAVCLGARTLAEGTHGNLEKGK